MKTLSVAINTTVLKNAHKERGIGSYTYNLIHELVKNSQVKLQEFEDLDQIKDADLIHYPWFDFFFNTLPKKKNIPVVVTVHDAIPLRFKERYPIGFRGRVNLFLQKGALKKSSAIITDSKASKEDIVKFLDLKKEKITVIPLAADKNFRILQDAQLTFIKRKYRLTDQFLLYVGDANWVKNLPFLIEAFKNLSNRPNFKNLKLVLIGGAFLKKVENIDHPELESLKKTNRLINEYNLEDKIVRSGYVEKEELIAFYNLATIYVQPSIYEGFGLPVLEAMSCGVPVVSSNGGGLREVGGEAAIYFDPSNINQFESIVTSILEDKSLQNKLSRLSLKQAERFSWEKVAAETLEVYSDVTNF